MTLKERIKERFFAMVSAPDANGCRTWKGHVSPNGYGTFQLAMGGEHASELAHRVAFAIGTDDFSILRFFGGPHKRGPVVRHGDKCPKHCVEFKHLRAGTQKQNIEDNARTGKVLHGEAVGTSKLTAEQVVEIRADYAKWPKSELTGKPKRGALECLAQHHGVSRQMIWQIVHRRQWQHMQ